MKALRLKVKPRTIGYMRYLSKMKDLGPRRMSQDQNQEYEPKLKKQGSRVKTQNQH